MPTLPPFTVHTLLKQTKLDAVSENKGKVTVEQYTVPFGIPDYIPMVEMTKEELKEMYPVAAEETSKALTGEDNFAMVPVLKSTNILAIGWKEEKLRIQFKGLHTYEFSPISEEMWLQFLTARSK